MRLKKQVLINYTHAVRIAFSSQEIQIALGADLIKILSPRLLKIFRWWAHLIFKFIVIYREYETGLAKKKICMIIKRPNRLSPISSLRYPVANGNKKNLSASVPAGKVGFLNFSRTNFSNSMLILAKFWLLIFLYMYGSFRHFKIWQPCLHSNVPTVNTQVHLVV